MTSPSLPIPPISDRELDESLERLEAVVQKGVGRGFAALDVLLDVRLSDLHKVLVALCELQVECESLRGRPSRDEVLEEAARLAESFSAYTGHGYCDPSESHWSNYKPHDYGRGNFYAKTQIAAAIRALCQVNDAENLTLGRELVGK